MTLQRLATLLCVLGLGGCCLSGSAPSLGECDPFAADRCEGSSMVHCTMGRGALPYVERTECEYGCFDAVDSPVCAHHPTGPCTPGEPDRCGAPIDVGVLLERCRAITAGGGMWDYERECFGGCTDGRCIE